MNNDNNVFKRAILMAAPEQYGGNDFVHEATSVCPFCQSKKVSDGQFPSHPKMDDITHLDNCPYAIAKAEVNICCANCKYWKADDKKEDIGECDFMGTITGEKINKENKDMSIDIDIFVHDDSGLYFSLMTGKNFYCPHFSPIK